MQFAVFLVLQKLGMIKQRFLLQARIYLFDLFYFSLRVQSAVIKVFKGGALQTNELYTLNESIR